MGVPSEKATNSAITIKSELEYIAEVVGNNPDDIYEEGRAALRQSMLMLIGLVDYLERKNGGST